MSDKQEAQLSRKLSPINVWSLALGCIIGWGAFVMPGNTFLGQAGPLGTAVAMALSALIMAIISFNYHYMINLFPVAGGDFTYARQAFGGKHAFVCSWFLGLSYLTIVPLNATALALIGRNLLNNVFQVGFHYTVAGYDVYLGEILLALFALVLFAVLSIRGVEFTGIFQTGLVLVLVGGIVLVSIAALVSGKASIQNLTPAFPTGGNRLAGILAVVAVAPWAFVGFGTIPQAAEEFNFSPRKTRFIMVLSILFGALVYVVLNTVTAAVVPEGYSGWQDYIAAAGKLDGLLSLPTFHAAYELLGGFGLVVIGLAVTGAILSGIIGFYMATSRLMYSMSKERVLPEWFGRLHGKYSTPSNAILFVLAFSVVAPFFGRTAIGWIVDMSSIGAAIGYGYTSAAALRFARREKNTGIMFTGALGLAMSILFAVLLLVPIPALQCSLGRESYICLAVWILLGVIFFLRSQKH